MLHAWDGIDFTLKRSIGQWCNIAHCFFFKVPLKRQLFLVPLQFFSKRWRSRWRVPKRGWRGLLMIQFVGGMFLLPASHKQRGSIIRMQSSCPRMQQPAWTGKWVFNPLLTVTSRWARRWLHTMYVEVDIGVGDHHHTLQHAVVQRPAWLVLNATWNWNVAFPPLGKRFLKWCHHTFYISSRKAAILD